MKKEKPSDDHTSEPASKALLHYGGMKRPRCVCRKCRGKDETLAHAMRRIRDEIEVERYGVEGAAARKQEVRERLAALSGRKK